MKKIIPIILTIVIVALGAVAFVACDNNDDTTTPYVATVGDEYSQEAYEMVQYIDANLSERDSIAGENFIATQQWIVSNLKSAGYTDADIQFEEFDITRTQYYKIANLENVVASYETDGKTYAKQGWSYVEDPAGEYTKFTSLKSQNIIVTKQGKSNKQIIIGMHYDGDGTGDNGSGIALGLITAMKLFNTETDYTLKFVFFSAEEIGLIGSTANANNMSEEEIANTEYMINMDSLVCGDYCYLYGGVQDDANKTVTQIDAYQNAMSIADDLGLVFLSNPWSYDNPTPTKYNFVPNDATENTTDVKWAEDAIPDYASPSTGDWSDHVGFKKVGISYVYFEATNWMLGPDYDGYEETAEFGPLMNTANDYLEKIEELFPGRIQKHLKQFSTLLTAMLLQTSSAYNA